MCEAWIAKLVRRSWNYRGNIVQLLWNVRGTIVEILWNYRGSLKATSYPAVLISATPLLVKFLHLFNFFVSLFMCLCVHQCVVSEIRLWSIWLPTNTSCNSASEQSSRTCGGDQLWWRSNYKCGLWYHITLLAVQPMYGGQGKEMLPFWLMQHKTPHFSISGG